MYVTHENRNDFRNAYGRINRIITENQNRKHNSSRTDIYNQSDTYLLPEVVVYKLSNSSIAV